ncbi:DUF4386 domain-containing protein [Nocardia sp. NPDC058058]|uniref:DUF4386 domain-containing protein n=1 Tax=Nocardia sp. NPDC058058 TaxID=3346317 RepID=UPI0036DC5ACF
MTTSTSPARTAVPIVAAVLSMNAGFIGLGAVFDYPKVLARPSAEVLALFRAQETAVVSWFALLALGAALFIPIAILVGRLDDSPRMRWAVRIGIAAGVVQAIGLLRWPLLVPTLADRATHAAENSSATRQFEIANLVLGSTLGETCGYALTAAWTLLVATVLSRNGFPRWFTVSGIAAAVLILTGIAAPWHIPGAQQLNFLGYVLWSLWMLALVGFALRGITPRSRPHQSPRRVAATRIRLSR